MPDDVARDERREGDRVQVDVRAVAVVAAVEEHVLEDRRDAEAVGAGAAVEEQRDHLRDDLIDVAERLVERDVEAGGAVQRDVDVRGRVAGERERLADCSLEVGEADAKRHRLRLHELVLDREVAVLVGDVGDLDVLHLVGRREHALGRRRRVDELVGEGRDELADVADRARERDVEDAAAAGDGDAGDAGQRVERGLDLRRPSR